MPRSKKKLKVSKVNSDQKEKLAVLAAYPEFKTFEQLLAIEKNAIILSGYSLRSSEPDLRIKKAHYEGRMSQVLAFENLFRSLLKDKE